MFPVGGLPAAHQFVRIGPQTMVGAASCVRGDVIPFAPGERPDTRDSTGLNATGMEAPRIHTRERLAAVIRSFYQRLFHGPGVFAERLSEVSIWPARTPQSLKSWPLLMPKGAARCVSLL